MSACLRELYALVTATSSALSRPDPYYQSMVEYALYYDVEPSLFYSLLVAALGLLSLTLLLALVVLVRALRRSRPAEAGSQSPASSSSSPPSSPLLSELRHSVDELQSRLTIADHARDAAQRRLTEREAAMEDERRRMKAAHRKALDDGAEAKKDSERKLAAARKDLDQVREEQRRAREERIRLAEEAEARRHEDNKAKAKAKKDDKDERERREKEEKRILDLSAALQRQLDERTAQLKEAERKREEVQANMARLEDNISRYRAEVKERVEREEQLRAQLERSAQPVAVPERKKGDEERRWSEMDVVVRQLQHQNSSLMAELEQEKERKANHDQDADRESAAVKADEVERARVLQAKDDRITELTARLTEREAELQRAQREVQALKERQEELTLECQHEEEMASELKEDIAERDATIEDLTLQLRDLRTRLESQLTAKDRVLLVKEEECARDQEPKGRMRALLNWPVLPPPNASRPSPPAIAIPASSVPSSPSRRGSQPTMSVPSSPTAISLRADLEQYAQRLREAQLILAESPKAKAGRKEKARLVRKAREEVFDLMKRKKEVQDALEREEQEDGNTNRLPPVPLFTAAAADERAEVEAENAQLRVQLEDFHTRFTEQTATVLRLRGELSDAQQRVAALLRSTVTATTHQAALASVAALQTRVTSEEGKAQQLTEQLALGAIKVAELTLTTENQAAAIVDLSNRVAASRTELLTARRQRAEKEKDLIITYEKEAEELSAQISAAAETASTLTATSQSQTSTIAELNGRITALQSELSALGQSTVPLVAHRELEARLTAQIASLEQQEAQHRAALHSTQSALESERNRVAALSSQVDALTARLAQSTTDAANAGSTIASLRTQVESLQSAESQLASSSSRSSSEIAQLHADLVAHTARIAQLSSSNDELTSELAKRQADVQSLQEERDSLASLKRETADRLEGMERELQTTETRRAALEAQMYGAVKQVHAERRGLELQQQQEIARWEDKLLATQLSADTAVQAAEDEAERSSAAVAELQQRTDAANAQLQSAEAKAAEMDRLLRAVESQRDRAQKALKAVEDTCAGFLEDLRLKESDIAELKERVELKETELADLRHLFEQLKKEDARNDAEDDDLQRRDQEQHDHLNHSLIQLETAVQASAMRRGNTLEHSAIAVMMREHTPVKPRRFVFINNDQPPISPRGGSAAKSPRNAAVLLSTPVVLSPSSSASALSARSSDAAALVASLQSTVASLRNELKEKEDALAEETKKVEVHQATIERLRQQAKGARDGGLTALHRLQASQSRMEELNRTLSAKMAAIHNRKTSAPVADAELRIGDVDHNRHASAPMLPADAALSSAEVSTLLTQLQSEHALVREQAAQLCVLRQQQQVEAAFQASIVQRLEASEERRLRLKRQVRRQQEAWEVEKAKIEALIEMSTAELEELEEQREERESRITDLEAQLHTWKDKAEQLTAKIDDWAQQEHEETSHREPKKEYLKRRWHELTYGGHRHCPSCERAAANAGSVSAHGHGQKTPVKKAGDKEKRSRSPSSSSLQIPSPHKRSHSDGASHGQGGAEEHRHHHVHDHDGDVTEDDVHDLLDAEAVVAAWKSWKATVDKLQRDSEHDEQTKLDLQSLAEHLTRLTSSTQHVHGALREKELEKLEMSLVLPSFDLTGASAITAGSGGSSDALHSTKDAREAERRLLQAAREKEEAMAACARLERELREERLVMKNMEAELALTRGELAERRKDEAQVHTVLQQARSHVALHSRKPSSQTSVQSFNSATSSAYYSDEQKELEERDGVVDPFLYPDAALKAAERRYLEALAEIDSLAQLRREDEAKIEEAIRQLRLSREQVCTDYADMLSLSQQLTAQQKDIEDLKAQLHAKDAVITQLHEQVREAKEAGGVSGVLTASMVEGELGEVEARLKEMTEAAKEKDAMLRGLQTQVKELRDFIGMQEGTIRKLEKQRTVSQHRLDQLSRPQPSAAHPPQPSSVVDAAAQQQQQQDALIALAQLSKDFRAEQRLRVELQRTHQLAVVSPIASPSHSRAGSGEAASQDSPRGAPTPQRMAGAGLTELAWWQQHARRSRGGSSSSSTASPFSSPATGVLSALSGAFTNDGAAGSRTGTPGRSRPASVESATETVSTPTRPSPSR